MSGKVVSMTDTSKPNNIDIWEKNYIELNREVIMKTKISTVP